MLRSREKNAAGDSACHEKQLLDWLKNPDREKEPCGRLGFAVSAVMSPELSEALRQIKEADWPYPNLQPPQAEITLVEPLPKVLGNEAGLVQCFSNLLGNAVKFVPADTVPRVKVWAGRKRIDGGKVADEQLSNNPVALCGCGLRTTHRKCWLDKVWDKLIWFVPRP